MDYWLPELGAENEGAGRSEMVTKGSFGVGAMR
jgi:hypothetical protein